MLLRFKKEIIQAARKADDSIINVVACESWVELRILVPYGQYRGKNGLDGLREAIEAENSGVVIPPFSMKWMRAWRIYEEQWQRGTLPRGRASVIFKVPNKAAGRGLVKEIWVAGNRFQAEIFVPSKADTLCTICSRWGHSEFRCHSRQPACGICAGNHRTTEHRCEVATCGAQAKACGHTTAKCPNCGQQHQVQDRRCGAKMQAMGIARGHGHPGRQTTTEENRNRPRLIDPHTTPYRSTQLTGAPQAADWSEVEAEIDAAKSAAAEIAATGNEATENAETAAAESDTEMTTSGTAPPMTS
jgi:hypothetical protein